MTGSFFMVSNLLSIARILIIIPIAILLVDNTPENNALALVLAAIGCLTDYLDGYFARKLNQVSDLGKILDPLADKVGVLVLSLVLVVYREFPMWLFAAILIRDLAIVFGGIFMAGKRKIIVQPNFIGKVAVNVFAGTVIIYMMDLTLLMPWAVGLSAVAIVVSSVSYLRNFLKTNW